LIAFPDLSKEAGRESRGRFAAEDRPASTEDRFFETALATHRGIADAAGVNGKAAVHQLAIERTDAMAGVSRRDFYRFDPNASPGQRDMDLPRCDTTNHARDAKL
jgi:hypothetical protein